VADLDGAPTASIAASAERVQPWPVRPAKATIDPQIAPNAAPAHDHTQTQKAL